MASDENLTAASAYKSIEQRLEQARKKVAATVHVADNLESALTAFELITTREMKINLECGHGGAITFQAMVRDQKIVRKILQLVIDDYKERLNSAHDEIEKAVKDII